MKDVLLKIEFVLMFVDAKVLLLVWILLDLYRNTMLVDSLDGHTTGRITGIMEFVWRQAGSPYILWIPLAAFADVLIKHFVRKMI